MSSLRTRDPIAAAVVLTGAVPTTFTQHKVLWPWIPAFAGKTMLGHESHPRGAKRPSCPPDFRPLERAWGMPGARCTRGRACGVVNTRVSHHGYTGSPGIPARNGFNGFLRALPVTGLFCHRRLRTESANLTPASGREDHTTSPSASSRIRQSAACVHRIPPRVRDDRDTPLKWDETARNIEVIWVRRKAIFLKFRKKSCSLPGVGRRSTGGVTIAAARRGQAPVRTGRVGVINQVSPPAKISFLITA